jgi:2-dehydro-3-deoxyphosphooctonate aldolase (KDO 8-P synthase)
LHFQKNYHEHKIFLKSSIQIAVTFFSSWACNRKRRNGHAIAEKLIGITEKLQIPYVFKGSFKKANRSRIDSFSGIGDEKALKILRKVSETFGVPTVTDIHTNEDAEMAAQYVDVLQIPAFLVRQTDLVVAAANTGRR